MSDFQKNLVREKLANRITAEGDLLITCSEHRTQTQNRDAAVVRFTALLAGALKRVKARKKTKATRGSKERPARRESAPAATSRRGRGGAGGGGSGGE